MDISCPQCDTLYELDDRQIDDAGPTTLQCSQCAHLFRLEPQTGVQSESRRRWMVRRHDSGDMLYFTGFDTLHQWIMDQKVGARDAISRTGNSWTRLGEIGEFAPVFQVVESIADLSNNEQVAEESDKLQVDERNDEAGAAESTSSPAASTGRQEPVRRSRTAQSTPVGQRRDSRRRDSSAELPEVGGQAQGPPGQGGDTNEKGTSRPSKRQRVRQSSDSTTSVQSETGSAQAHRGGSEPETNRGESNQSTATGDRHRKPDGGVNLDDERFGAADGDDEQAADQESSDEWTLGELEHRQSMETPPEVDASPRRRRWPWVVAVLLIVGGVVGFLQRETVEEMMVTVHDDIQEEQTRDVVEVSDEQTGVAVGEVVETTVDGVETARSTVRQQVVGEAVAASSENLERSVEEAGQEAEESTEPEPRSVSDLMAAGQRALDSGRSGDAVELFEAVLKEQPYNPEALTGLGWGYLGGDRVDAAVEQFESARQQDSSFGDSLIGLGRAERSRGRKSAALEAYEQYLEDFPDGAQRSIAEHQSNRLRDALDE